MLWKTLGIDASLLHSWDNETVLFHEPSGQLHVINDDAAEVLLTLQDKPSSARMLAEKLSAKWRVELTSEFVAEIEEILLKMQTLLLVDRV